LSLDHSKSVGGLIPVKLLKLGVERCSPILATLFNSAINTGVFPHDLKLADIIPCHKKDSALEKSNYRPISLLPTISKVFERLMVNQMLPFLYTFLSKFLCGFRKGHSTQHALINLLERWQNHLSSGDKVGALLMDLSKAFDVLPHNLLLAKLQAYGFESPSLNLIQSYLFNRNHRVRISSIFSEWLNLGFLKAQY
uniref:Reverse transcriptase domain-containing protein n=1 Tax=Clytia hemisphaerica TaxID=252671 RepID=A0A7M5XI00_9CNID